MKTALATVVLLVAITTPVPAALVVGQTDDFQDGTTQGWRSGVVNPNPPSNVATGGPLGAGDRYLQIVSTGGVGPGSKLIAFNTAQWAGDYLAAGVTGITMDLKNLGSSPLSMRIGLMSSTLQGSPGYVTSTAFPLPVDGNWHHAVFGLSAADLTGINAPPALSTILSGTAELRILHSAGPALNGDNIVGSVGVDNIAAVPEPATLLLISGGLLGVLRRRRSRRT